MSRFRARGLVSASRRRGDDEPTTPPPDTELMVPTFGGMTNLGDPDPTDALVEASGLVISRKNVSGNIFWTHNDSGDTNRIFAIKETSGLLAQYTIEGASNDDWEDIAIGPGPDSTKDYLYIGNIGSGASNPREIYRVAEPSVSIGQSMVTATIPSSAVETFSYTSPVTDAEGFFVDPITGDIFLFQKRSGATRPLTAEVYRIPAAQLVAGGGSVTPQLVGPVRALQDTVNDGGITAADISADGNYFVISNYQEIFMWPRDHVAGESVGDVILANSVAPYHHFFSSGWGTETITFNNDKSRLYTIAEGPGSGLKYVSLTWSPTSTPSPSSAVERLMPATGALWGLYVTGNDVATFDAMESEAGREFAISKLYYSNMGSTNIPTSAHLAHATANKTIHIAWTSRITSGTAPGFSGAPPTPQGAGGQIYAYTQFSNGSMDPHLRWLAGQLKLIDRPFFFDVNHEPENQSTTFRKEAFSDPNWYDNRAANGEAYTKNILKEYADAVRHIHSIFVEEAVENIVWVQTYASVGSNGSGYDPYYGALWPGDDVIDVLAWDPYSNTSATSATARWAIGRNKFLGGLLDDAFYQGTGAKSKPWMLSEYGCQDPSYSNKADWMSTVVPALKAYPEIKAIQYYSAGISDIHTNAAARAAFNTASNDPFVMPPAGS